MNVLEVRDEIFAALLKFSKDNSVDVKWPDQPETIFADVWIRPTLNHTYGGQASLGSQDGTRRWNRSGFLTIQVFAPVAQGMERNYELAQKLVNLFQGWIHPCLWFRNVSLMEAGADGAFTQINVSAVFKYDDIR